MKFEKEYFVGIKDIGKENHATNAGFLSFLEEIASNHSATVGYGVNDIQTKNKVWLLMDWKLQVFERPQYGDALKIKTWARPIEKSLRKIQELKRKGFFDQYEIPIMEKLLDPVNSKIFYKILNQ